MASSAIARNRADIDFASAFANEITRALGKSFTAGFDTNVVFLQADSRSAFPRVFAMRALDSWGEPRKSANPGAIALVFANGEGSEAATVFVAEGGITFHSAVSEPRILWGRDAQSAFAIGGHRAEIGGEATEGAISVGVFAVGSADSVHSANVAIGVDKLAALVGHAVVVVLARTGPSIDNFV